MAKLDFGVGVFDGASRHLEIAVRCPSGVGAYTTLSPRQAFCPTPFAINASGLLLPFIAFQFAQDIFFITNTAGDTPATAITALRGELINATVNPFSAAVHGEAAAAIGVRGVTTFNGVGGQFFAQNDGRALVANSTATDTALEVGMTGTGPAASIEIANGASNAIALEVNTDGGGDAVCAATTGTGPAGNFAVNNPASGAAAVQALTDGSGPALVGTTTGTGRAAEFRVVDPNGPAPASGFEVLRVVHEGAGPAAYFQSGIRTGAFLPFATLFSENHRTTGSAGDFVNRDPNNPDVALIGDTRGNGAAGAFFSGPRPLFPPPPSTATLSADNFRGSGYAAEFTNHDPNSFDSTLYVTTKGFGFALEAENDNGSALVARTSSPFSTGVLGVASDPNDTITTGVRGLSFSPSGYGVWGVAAGSTGQNIGVRGSTESTEGRGVYGFAQTTGGFNYGVFGESASADGTGVKGLATRPIGSTIGVIGESQSKAGTGVYGLASSTAVDAFTAGVQGEIRNGPGAAVLGLAPPNGHPSRAVWGINGGNGVLDTDPNALAVAVEGLSTPTTGGKVRGVRGITRSDNGIGVEGLASNDVDDGTQPPSIGVLGTSHHPRGDGVVAINAHPSPDTDASGLYATIAGPGTAVRAQVTSGAGGRAIHASGGDTGIEAIGASIGVLGKSSSSTGAGVEATNVAGGPAVRCTFGPLDVRTRVLNELGDVLVDDNLNVSGTLTKAAGAFRIDHPLDPENKYLQHSFVESPDMMNIYNGAVVTDADGYATVELPDWFEALNRDFRYQLTVIDDGDSDSFVLAKVVERVHGNQFAIRTSEPFVEVSWQVTGIRQDAWAEQNRIQVETLKPESERGVYLHAAANRASAELGIDREPTDGGPGAD